MKKQDEIKHLINTLGIKVSSIAEKVGLKSQTLNYLIYESEEFDDELYEKIKEIIDNYQFELDLFEEEEQMPDLFSEEFNLGIGERIRIFAKQKYGTLKKLAAAMKISPQQLQQYISGKREPGSKILARLLRLGCDINWLLGGKESLESYKIQLLESKIKKLKHSLQQISSIIKKENGIY
ncbi:helix-turn-helix domain-containing protein [Melioribacteraceae bacterium 4301-Me]|uniref:helix-turn-helix domain-containing protein n=1 Tax=Pyranulibacter aquaticus TaxID=3163344 RepID=UPI003598E6AA